MGQIETVKFKPFFFVPDNWEDLFVDAVFESYAEYVKVIERYQTKRIPAVPLVTHLIEEDDIIMIVDKITCDVEYGVHYPEDICFKSEQEDNDFQELCVENLMFSIHDIGVVFDRYHICHKVGLGYKNMPMRAVW